MTGKALFRFPALNAQQILKNVAERWDLSGLLPLPIWDMQCPVCWARMSENLIQPRQWRFHARNMGGKNPWRCDISFKCCSCSHAFTFGVAVPEQMFQIAKGYVRPFRSSYIHSKCGVVTRMAEEIAQTYARNQKFYGATFCVGCKDHFPVGEFTWDRDGSVVGS